VLRPAKVITVVRREYLSRVRTKAFWISTVLVPVFMLAMGVLPSYFMERTGGSFTVAIMTSDEVLAQRVGQQLAAGASEETGQLANLQVKLEVVRPERDVTTQRDHLRKRILAKQLAALVVMPDDVLTSGKVEYVSTNLTAFRLMSRVRNAVERAVVASRLERAGVPAARVPALTKGISLDTVRVTSSGQASKESEGRSFILSYVLTILIYITVMIYGNYVMRGVLEEKSSRIVEVIVANLSASELMAGKVLGVGAVGLTQYAIWAVAAMNLAVPGLLGAGIGAALSPQLLVFFVVFFVLGYFLYATVYAAVGAAFNTEEEAHQLQSVLSIAMAVPFVLMFPVLASPDATSSVVLSLIPFFAPMLFFLRMTVSMPPTWQIALCLGLLLATLVVMVRLAAAVYRVGILMYGKKPTVKEIARWMRAS
jgi:ABC-2 type transport system permease protein